MKKLVSFVLICALLTQLVLLASAQGESGIQSLDIADLSFYQNTNGYTDRESGHYIYSYYPEATITLQDGQTVTLEGSGSIEIDGTWYTLTYTDQVNQYEEQWTAGNTYTVTAELGDVSDTFTVTILENPIERIEFEPIAIPEKALTHYWNDQYYIQSLTYTAYLRDGTVVQKTGLSLPIDWQQYSFSLVDNQPNEPWELGGTYTITAGIFGINYPIEVTIVDNPKKAVAMEVEDTAVMVGTSRSDGTYPYVPHYTLTLQDGTKVQSSGGFVDPLGTGLSSYSPQYLDTQYQEPWELGGTYTVTAVFQDATDTFTVTVEESAIQSVEFDDAVIIENANGAWMDEGYFCYTYHPAFTVTFQDGTKQKFAYPAGLITEGYLYDNAFSGGGESYGLFPTYTDNQAQEHWQTGGTYTATASFMGFTDTFEVTVIENPVESITAKELTCVLGEQTEWYNKPDSLKELQEQVEPTYTFTLKDGTVVTSEPWIDGGIVSIYGESYSFWSFFAAPPVPGNYLGLPVTLYAFGTSYEVSLPAEVVTPEDFAQLLGIEAFEIADVQVFSADGSNYSVDPLFTLTLQDGSTLRSDEAPLLRNLLQLDPRVYENQNSWQVGDTDTFTGTFCGLTDDFTVTVIENPIEGLVSQSITCVSTDNWNPHLFWDSDAGRFQYAGSLCLSSLEFQLKDGTVAKASKGSIDTILDLYLYQNHYAVGTEFYQLPCAWNQVYDGRVSVGNGSYDLSVTFLPLPDGAMPGDLTDDQVVDPTDAMTALSAYIGQETLSDAQLAAADVNLDATVDPVDAMLMLQNYVGTVKTLPVR